ncbi:MAG: MerR family transcriptional regulator [Actinomycetaceae bacterium]|nr:MerR family transcriptional regulator [Actinomycetaceae bacterium]
MPRVTLAHTMNDVPLTVAAAAHRVGVPPSTLRTWDRRYGLSPSARTVGAHRRYTALDIARLHRMCSLIARGVSASDAAHTVASEPIDVLGVDYELVSIYPEDLETAAKAGDELTIRSIIDKSVAEEGLVRTWIELIKPALEHVKHNEQTRRPGFCPVVFMQNCVLETIGRVMDEAHANKDHHKGLYSGSVSQRGAQQKSAQVIVASTHQHVIEVNVLGTALTWEGIEAQALCTSEDIIDDVMKNHIENHDVEAVILVEDACSVDTITSIQSVGVTVVLTGEDAPRITNPNVTRLRTMSATVDEVVSMLG